MYVQGASLKPGSFVGGQESFAGLAEGHGLGSFGLEGAPGGLRLLYRINAVSDQVASFSSRLPGIRERDIGEAGEPHVSPAVADSPAENPGGPPPRKKLEP